MTDESLKKAKVISSEEKAREIVKGTGLEMGHPMASYLIIFITKALDDMRPQWPTEDEIKEAQMKSMSLVHPANDVRVLFRLGVEWLKERLGK